MPAEPTGLRRLARGFTRPTWLAIGWLAALAALACLSPLLPLDPGRIDLRQRAAGPSWRHPFGTTRRGADLLAVVIDGSHDSLAVGAGAAALAVTLGATAGLWVGYRKGWIDRAAVLVGDVMIALPGLAVALVASLVLGGSKWSLAALIGVLLAPAVFRIVRTVARFQAGQDYLVAAQVSGARTGRILRHELLPNVTVPLVAYGFVLVGVAILIEGGLAFLGIGSDANATSWGALIAAGQGSLAADPHLSLVPAGLLIVTLVASTVVGEGVQRDGFKPLRQVAAAPRRRTTSPAATNPAATPAPAPAANPAPAGKATLSVRNLGVAYRSPFGTLPVLAGVDLDARPGRTIAIVGESGSGKSTLIRAMLGLLPANGSVTMGAVHLDGQPLTPATMATARGRRIALVMQNPTRALNPMRTVGAQLSDPMRHHLGLDARAARRRAVELLDRVAVPEPARRLDQYPFQLSGGLAQRVCIALALSCDPEILLADEPTASLDSTVAAEVLSLLDELKRTLGLAVVLVSHSLDLVGAWADEVVVLHGGRVVETGPTSTVLGRAAMPYTRALLEAAPKLQNSPHTRLAAMPSDIGSLGLAAPGCSFAPRCRHASERCAVEIPPLAPIGDPPGHPEHRVACWHPG